MHNNEIYKHSMKDKLLSPQNIFLAFIFVLVLEVGGFVYIMFFSVFGLTPIQNVTINEAYGVPDMSNVMYFSEEAKVFFENVAEEEELADGSNMGRAKKVREFVRILASNPDRSSTSYAPTQIFQEYQKDGGVLICGALSLMEGGFLHGMDIPFRLIQLVEIKEGSNLYFPKGNYSTHRTLEVWSDEHQKWYISDPTFNARIFDADSRPLSAVELRDIRKRSLSDASVKKGKLSPYQAAAVRIEYGEKDKREPTFASYKIDPLLLYNHVLLVVGGKPPGGILERVLNRYTKTHKYLYVIDEAHSPTLFPVMNFSLDYIGPLLLIFFGSFYAFMIIKNRRISSEKILLSHGR